MEVTIMPGSVRNTGFYCRKCYHFTERDQITDRDIISEPIPGEDESNEVEYIICPACGEIAVEAGLNFRGISKINSQKLQTGPTTEAGRKKLAELARKNLHGPVTPEGKERISKNAFKHGRYSTKMKELAPANHEKYPFCDDCDPEIKTRCENKEIRWCPVYISKQLDYYALHVNGDIEGLSKFAAESQAKLSLVLEMMFGDIFTKGVLITDKKTWEGGSFDFTKANPLVELILKTLDTLGQTSDQQGTNPKTEKEGAVLDGFLKQSSINSEISELEKFRLLQKQNKKDLLKLRKDAKDMDK